MSEQTMYPIIKSALEAQGFVVKAEVSDADVVAAKANKMLIVEMKQTFSTTLIYQGIERLTITDYVYLAIPKPSDKVLSTRGFKEKKTIVRQLGLGLMLIDLEVGHLTFVLDPTAPHARREGKRARKLKEEFLLRKTALNKGGVTQTKIVTAYRELALTILDFLRARPQPIQAIVKHTNRMKTSRVLQDNHYGWFERVKRGVYQMSDAGREAVTLYADVITALREAQAHDQDDA